MPFGALQTIAILCGCYAAAKFKIKSAVLAGMMCLVVAGCAMIYVEGTASHFNRSVALGGYYLMAFLFGGNPLIVSWIVSSLSYRIEFNADVDRSQTLPARPRSLSSVSLTQIQISFGTNSAVAFFNAASAAGNIIGPLLFKAKDKPYYAPGVRAVLIIFIALVGLIGIQVVILFLFNKQRQRQRVAAGKPAHIHDTSMESKYQAYGKDEAGTGVGQDGEFQMFLQES
jgi:hypothetical protein